MFLPHGHSKFFTQQTLRIFTATFASPCKLMKPLPKYKRKCCLHHSTKVSSFLLPALLTARLFKNKNPTTPTTKASKQSNSGQELRLSCCWLSFSQNFIPNIQSQSPHLPPAGSRRFWQVPVSAMSLGHPEVPAHLSSPI